MPKLKNNSSMTLVSEEETENNTSKRNSKNMTEKRWRLFKDLIHRGKYSKSSSLSSVRIILLIIYLKGIWWLKRSFKKSE